MLTSTSFSIGHEDPYYKPVVYTGKKSSTMPEGLADCNIWLPRAAEVYHISKNLKDYVIVPSPITIASIPNVKGDCVEIEDFLQFNHHHGMLAYKTFKGKATYYEHQNNLIPHLAKGVILDCVLRPLVGFGGNRFWKLILLSAFDRSKDPMLANALLSKEITSFSMGFAYNAYTCSICGHTATEKKSTFCTHTDPKRPLYAMPDGRLVYRQCHNVVGIENSAVANPAFAVAITNGPLNNF